MTVVQKLDSNITGLRYAEEASIGVLPASPVWLPLEPNSYDNFGGEITTVARNPINASRQRQKGTVTDLDASGGFNMDMTQTNLEDLMQGFAFADLRRKSDVGLRRSPARITVLGDTEDYLVTDIDGSNAVTIDSRVAVTAAVAVGGTGYAIGDTVTLVDAAATVTSTWTVLTINAGVVLTVAVLREGRASTDLGAAVATAKITGSGDDALTLTATYGDGIAWQADDLVFMSGNGDAGNNGLMSVASVADNVVTMNETLTLDGSPASTSAMTTVGFVGVAGDIDVDSASALPALTSTTLSFTTFGLIPGEWIFIGGDLAAEKFSGSFNNGFARIKTIAAKRLTFDKTQGTMVTEASTTETVKLFFGRVLKNESDPTLIRRRTYQLERSLGAPDDASPAAIQAEYLKGSVSNQITYNYATADKITTDLSYLSTDNEQVTAATGRKSGTRPTITAEDGFNTSSDFTRLKMSLLDPADSNPTALFAFLTEFNVVINNNVSPNKAISVLGAFDQTAGQFNVDGTATAYFSTIEAVQAVRNNSDVTLDFAVVQPRIVDSVTITSGVLTDIPLIALGDGRLNVELDQPITLPLNLPAAADRNFNHTLLMMFFDFLPSAADT